MADWKGFEARRKEAAQRGKLRGIGMSYYVEITPGNPQEIAKIDFAVENAANWLAKSRVAGEARWPDYPANTPAIKSASISGLILHVLHTCQSKESIAELDRLWLTNLPVAVTSANETEASNTYITLKNGALDFDRTRHYVLQWSLIATVDAYKSGTLLQRAAALHWIERVLAANLASPEVRNQNWVAAELLYALEYLRAYVEGGSAAPATSNAIAATK